eukprot:CAMPEP_0168614748 /NCGR_PEP_ID=MMETSP0449_2-20121227/4143_1 /TAXON_ID=1082188 /ORGANISM="Strombidium rassoulzadegani, Strain ras09" /LENGTH=106 /DNA_ID=CAMNT_0008655455 /DNA_START=134 /DNA_END=454 /DNA_ORIENTATION=-
MAVRSKAAVLEEKIKVDQISSSDIDFGTIIDTEIANIQRFLYGFLNGTKTIGGGSICTSALISFVDQSFKLIEFRYVWLPEYTMKFNNAQSKATDYMNTAYAYCNF